MDSVELFVCCIWVIWVSQLTYKAPQTIGICNIVDKQLDTVHLLCRKEEVVFVNERSHFTTWFGCRVLRHDMNGVQKTCHQMLQFSECNCMGYLCSLLSWWWYKLGSQLADMGGWLWGLTWWWICHGANDRFHCLLWVQARAITDNCQWCWYWFNSGLAGKWSDGETLLVAGISNGIVYIHWWMMRMGVRGRSHDWGSGSDWRSSGDPSSSGNPFVIRWHTQVVIGDSMKSWGSVSALHRGAWVDCLEVIPVFPAWFLQSIHKHLLGVHGFLYKHLVYKRE